MPEDKSKNNINGDKGEKTVEEKASRKSDRGTVDKYESEQLTT
jgi:hypothetical protein